MQDPTPLSAFPERGPIIDADAFERAVEREFDEAARPLIEDLKRAGYSDDALSVFINSDLDYEDATPILARWLPRIDNTHVKEAIVRALTVPYAGRHVARLLIEEFRDASDDPLLQWAIANALAVVADETVVDEVVKFAEDKRYGKAREMLAVTLGNVGGEEAADSLMTLLKDPEVAGHALIGVGKLRLQEARPDVEALLYDKRAWVRREAKRTLRKLRQSSE
jgi:hypothetical protein